MFVYAYSLLSILYAHVLDEDQKQPIEEDEFESSFGEFFLSDNCIFWFSLNSNVSL